MKRNNTKTNAKRKPYTLKIRVNYKSDNESDRRKNVTKAVRNFMKCYTKRAVDKHPKIW